MVEEIDRPTGHKGVYFIKGRYVAKIVLQKKQYYLGSYATIEEAVEVRKEAEEKLYGTVVSFYEAYSRACELYPDWGKENPMKINVRRNVIGDYDVAFMPAIATVMKLINVSEAKTARKEVLPIYEVGAKAL